MVCTTANSSPPIRATTSTARTIAAQPIADLDQQTVATMVTEGVIDLLETIEIQVEQGSALSVLV